MITDDKIKQIKKSLRQGVPEGEIKEDLIREGYSKEDIDKAFIPHHYDMRTWYMVFGILFLLIGLWLLMRWEIKSVLGLSLFLFFMYYREIQRLKNLKERSERQS